MLAIRVPYWDLVLVNRCLLNACVHVKFSFSLFLMQDTLSTLSAMSCCHRCTVKHTSTWEQLSALLKGNSEVSKEGGSISFRLSQQCGI